MRSFYLSRHWNLGKLIQLSLNLIWEITSKKTKKVDFGALLTEGYKAGHIRDQLEKLYPDFAMYKKGREGTESLDERRKSRHAELKRIQKMIKPLN